MILETTFGHVGNYHSNQKENPQDSQVVASDEFDAPQIGQSLLSSAGAYSAGASSAGASSEEDSQASAAAMISAFLRYKLSSSSNLTA